MATVDATKIHQGPGSLWLSVAVPATGSRLIIDAGGTPTSGAPSFGGATEGATTVALAPKLEPINADQAAAAVDVVMTGEAESIEVTLKESDLAKLKLFVAHGSFSSGTDANLPAALNRTLGWILSRLNANVSSFEGNAVEAQNDSLFIEGAMDAALGSLDDLPQVAQPNIVLDPLGLSDLDRTSGPDGFPINFSPQPVLGGNLLVNLLVPAKQGTVSGRVFNLVEPAASYRVDVYSRTDTFYFQGSSAIASDNTWSLANVHPGTVLAFLFPAALPAPQPGQAFLQVTGWVAHSNMGVGKRLRDYFVRVYAKTDLEYLQEDKIPIIVQDSAHARFGTSFAVQPGTPTAHVAFNDPKLGPVELYSTLQNLAVYSDLPRSIDVPPSDPDFAGPGLVVSSNIAYIQNRSWIYDASLAIVVLSMAGLWQAARRIVIRLNDLRKLPGYLPSISLEDAEEGSTAR